VVAESSGEFLLSVDGMISSGVICITRIDGNQEPTKWSHVLPGRSHSSSLLSKTHSIIQKLMADALFRSTPLIESQTTAFNRLIRFQSTQRIDLSKQSYHVLKDSEILPLYRGQ
jgi:hypothetical protein